MREDFIVNEFEGTEEETENYRRQKEIMEKTNNIEECETEEKCPRCGSPLYLSDLPQYDFVCLNCDENFVYCEVEVS